MDNEILKPLEGMVKAKPTPNLYTKIESALFENKIISMPKLALAAASILLLMLINIYAVNNDRSIEESERAYTEQLINDFQIY